ncbi:uncharacterized protein DNG_00608 [Cephalotrichum gorgonifer]|uniref:Cell wall proline rich protein n=1 Tax=Cephalotrichum gorgonifer TaxID=2041049 RepID=A0AAE8MPN1_9PEZI|nr:uncharacterized protein DNG_00608 [Cephalotrichum gorgonifer]
MNMSPTKEEYGFAPTASLPPPANRRGRHAHRRSAALSSHDLSIILQPPNAPGSTLRGGSAPTSPSAFTHHDVPSPSTPTFRLKAEPELHAGDPTPAPSTTNSGPVQSSPETPKPATRARVGFSETVEFIPRPLSLISCDTSSTVTVKPSHSVSGSISSLMSATTPPVMERGLPEQATPIPTREAPESRPSTAGAVLERTPSTMSVNPDQTSPRRRNSNPALVQAKNHTVDSVESAPTKAPKRWSFFGLEPFTSIQQNLSRPASSHSAEYALEQNVPNEMSPCGIAPAHATETSKPPTPRKRKGKKKVKTWAGSILTRKSKARPKGSKHSRSSTASSLHDLDKRATASDEGIRQEAATTPVTPEITVIPDWSASEMMGRKSAAAEEDSSYQMIDLDAALGPFNTPLPHNPEWDAAQRAAGNAKRQLHSAQKLRGFSGPGMHYHRRAESAPELVPFDGARFGMHRFGSNSTMADVFEEDEEEESSSTSDSEGENEGEKETPTPSEPSNESTPTPEAPAGRLYPVDTVAPSARIIRRRSSARSDAEEPYPTAVERSAGFFYDSLADENDPAVQFRTSTFFQGNASPASSAAPSPRRILAARDLAPVDVSPLQLPSVCHAPISPYSMSHGSSFPSPRSAMSVDAQRISTAPSSINEETSFQSLLLGQPGPEVRISVDDIPSLTSSNSTMTRESAPAVNAQPLPPPTRRPQRPSSVSSAAFSRRRSSLASLSRLISSSHGERSKLSMEVPLDDDSGNQTKPKKSKRLSRLVQFWKSKDADST